MHATTPVSDAPKKRMSLLEKAEASRPPRKTLDDLAFESDENGGPAWIGQVTALVRRIALRQKEFTSDEVWSEVHDSVALPLEPKLIGNALQRAQREGWILKTDRVRRSNRPACHRRPAAVWRSLICKASKSATTKKKKKSVVTKSTRKVP